MLRGQLTDSEYYVLDAVAANSGRAYLPSIRKYIDEQYGKDVSFGRQADILEKLEQLHWITSHWSVSGVARGQRRRKLYEITGLGSAVLSIERSVRHASALAAAGSGEKA